MRLRTESESLFETYCNERGYSFKRIEVIPNEGRFPDYEVVTPCGPVICEVKQVNPNDHDKEETRRLVSYGHADSSREPGKRARRPLGDACDQLRRFRDDPRPCIAMLFDMTYGHYLSPSDIEAAMLGDLIVLLPVVPGDGEADFTHGRNRRLNDKQGLYLGAVAVLTRDGRLNIYHNPYAQKRISPDYFPHPRDRHFMKKGHPDKSGYGWCEYGGQ